jgi:5'-nucleotidase
MPSRVLPCVLSLCCVLPWLGCRTDPEPPAEGEGEGEGEGRGSLHLRVHVIGDFHGALEPGPTLGGAAYLAAHLAERRQDAEHTLFVAAGDLIGASPLPSALQHDEPSLAVLGAMGLAASALGNHELDEGPAELLRLQHGGCHPDDDCGDAPWPGASFPFLAANVELDDGSLFLPASTLLEVGNARIGIVGAATRTTPSVVVPSGTEGLTFLDEAETIRTEAAALRDAGADAVIAITHVGAGIAVPGCFTGPAADLADAVKDDVDLLVSGHSHITFACVRDGLPVIATGTRGEVLGEVELFFDLDLGTVTQTDPVTYVVDHTLTPDPVIEALVTDAVAEAAVRGDVVVGTLTEDLTRLPSAAGESTLGAVVADSHLAITTELGAQVAFMNAGGLRAELLMAPSGDEAEGEVTYAEAFAVQPFGNVLKTFTVTGAELHTLLEDQFTGGQGIYLVAGISYAWSVSGVDGARVDPLSVFVNDAPLDLEADYRVTANEFLLGTPPFLVARDVQTGVVDVEGFAAWLTVESPVSAPTEPRITTVP